MQTFATVNLFLKEIFGKNVKKYRKLIGFTQEEMELILDVLKGNASKEDLTKINQLMQMRKVLS